MRKTILVCRAIHRDLVDRWHGFQEVFGQGYSMDYRMYRLRDSLDFTNYIADFYHLYQLSPIARQEVFRQLEKRLES